MFWLNPLPLRLVPTDDTLSFSSFAPGETGIPLAPHPGAFGSVRKNHVHEGVDLYCPEATPVMAVESGHVVGLLPFTGPQAGSPWWYDTDALLVEGDSGVVVYGEIKASDNLKIGASVMAGDIVGCVTQVLRVDKGRPMTMLHLELHDHGTRDVYEWLPNAKRPPSLRDPTPFLLQVVR